MGILSGFIKTIKYRLTDEGYKWQSEKTSSQTVVMGDGTDNEDTLEKRAGSIKGLTSAVNVTETGYALDATVGKKHEDAITALNNNLTNVTQRLGNIQSHVGMIIQTTTLDTEAKVKAIYGGTSWTKIEGRFLLGASSSYKVNSIGGEATHTLTTNEMPSHNHAFSNGGYSLNVNCNSRHSGLPNEAGFFMAQDNAFSNTIKNICSISASGGGKAHNNMPPYKAVYIWERTA